jgi:hypothetical protein
MTMHGACLSISRGRDRTLLLAWTSLALMSGCGSSSYSSSQGPVTVTGVPTAGGGTASPGFAGSAAPAGTDDTVVATPSTAVLATAVGANRTLSITFASSDGRPMTGFDSSETLGMLPAGWSGPARFGCTTVSTGSGCVLNLTYAPTAAGSGTLSIRYVVVDNAGLARTDGSLNVDYTATLHDNVVATESPSGEISAAVGAGAQPVNVNFTTDDGNAATSLMLTTDLTTLPAGWSSAQSNFSCAIISTGSGCQLALSYAATKSTAGVLTLSYTYVDDFGAPEAGTLSIPYASTTANNVVATASPPGQIIAVQKGGGQAVPVSFTTDDGNPATHLLVTSNLQALPAGWRTASTHFSCDSVSTGNGCQLPLNFAPSALGSGTLTLNYAYTDDAGTAKTGLLNIGYAATTNDNVVGTASPAGQVNAIVGPGTHPTTITFTTDDGRAATALQLTSDLGALPAGWTSAVGSFGCSGIDAASVCALPLTYAPAAAGGGSLALGYAYKNNAGEAKTGTVNIAYRATTDNNIVAALSPNPVAAIVGSPTGASITFTTDDGNPASVFSITTALDTLPTGWSAASSSFVCSAVSVGTGCVLSLVYAPAMAESGSLILQFSYLNDSGVLKTGTVLIVYSAM